LDGVGKSWEVGRVEEALREIDGAWDRNTTCCSGAGADHGARAQRLLKGDKCRSTESGVSTLELALPPPNRAPATKKELQFNETKLS
jgi:hypothetical protein